jgi:phosphoribosylformimino-5-aminoimidazole carboxamide ribotide isomerase
LDDISRIKFVPHVAACLVGRALFDRSIDISDALDIATQETGVTAQFQ